MLLLVCLNYGLLRNHHSNAIAFHTAHTRNETHTKKQKKNTLTKIKAENFATTKRSSSSEISEMIKWQKFGFNLHFIFLVVVCSLGNRFCLLIFIFRFVALLCSFRRFS